MMPMLTSEKPTMCFFIFIFKTAKSGCYSRLAPHMHDPSI